MTLLHRIITLFYVVYIYDADHIKPLLTNKCLLSSSWGLLYKCQERLNYY